MFDFIPATDELVHPRLSAPLPMELLSPLAQAACSAELAGFVTDEAVKLRRQLGFGWTALSSNAPNADQPQAAYVRSMESKVPLPVSNVSVGRTVFGHPIAAQAARFWKAVTLGKLSSPDYDIADELQLDLTMVDYAASKRVSRGSCWYLEADLLGHTMLRGLGFDHPSDSRTFTMDYLTFGEADAIVLEAERQHDARTKTALARE